MKIITWNVNGLRAIWKKGNLQELIEKENPDILCIQETKSEKDQLTKEMLEYGGYFKYFESSKMRKGYSGVSVYSKVEPQNISYTLGYPEEEFLDNEGRTLVLEYDKFFVMNCYWPNGGKSDDHFQYKLEYYSKFLNVAKKLEKQKPVIFLGDVNATRTDIDLARPKENAGGLGCTVEERDLLAQYSENFIDIWRDRNPEVQKYTWWDQKSRARDRDIGWRIDYIFISKILDKKVKSIEILSDQLGSDHCPVALELDI